MTKLGGEKEKNAGRGKRIHDHVISGQTRWPLSYDASLGLGYNLRSQAKTGSCHKRQKPQAPAPQAPVRNRQMRKVGNAKGLNRNTNLTKPNLN